MGLNEAEPEADDVGCLRWRKEGSKEGMRLFTYHAAKMPPYFFSGSAIGRDKMRRLGTRRGARRRNGAERNETSAGCR